MTVSSICGSQTVYTFVRSNTDRRNLVGITSGIKHFKYTCSSRPESQKQITNRVTFRFNISPYLVFKRVFTEHWVNRSHQIFMSYESDICRCNIFIKSTNICVVFCKWFPHRFVDNYPLFLVYGSKRSLQVAIGG